MGRSGFRSHSSAVVLAWVGSFAALLLLTMAASLYPVVHIDHTNYCTDTPEGKAVLRRIGDRVWNRKDNTIAEVQDIIQDIDKIRMWAAENTEGNEKKAWDCWCQNYMQTYTKKYQELYALQTVKYPP